MFFHINSPAFKPPLLHGCQALIAGHIDKATSLAAKDNEDGWPYVWALIILIFHPTLILV
jgi:hypothetical protein